jgi:hypothetical protein
MKKYITISFFLLSANLFGQQFYYYTGLEGVNYTNDQISSLETLAATIVDIIPDTSITNHFKVISVGAYPLSYSMNFDKEEVFGMICGKNNACNDNYILITRYIIDSNGNSRIFASIHFNDRISQCYNEESLNAKYLSGNDYVINQNSAALEEELIGRVYKSLDHIYNCCDVGNRSGCDTEVEEDAESISISNDKTEIHNDLPKTYISPAGCFFQLDGKITETRFGYFEQSNLAQGALLSFRKDGILYHAHEDVLTKSKFFGYKTKDGEHTAKSAQIFQNGEKEYIQVGLGFNNCTTNLYTFYATQSNCPMEFVQTGGSGGTKVQSFGLDYSVKEAIFYTEKQTIGAYGIPATEYIKEITQYIGDIEDFESINYAQEENLPCPDMLATKTDILFPQGDNVRINVDNKGRVYILSQLGYYSMYDHENIWVFYVYIPGRGWELYTPKEWVGPNQLALEIIDSGVALLKDPHNAFLVLSLSNVPLLSQVADLADGALYFIEGESGQGIISILGVIPGITEIYRGGNWTLDVASGLGKQYKWNKTAKFFEKSDISKANDLQDYISGLRMPKERVLQLKKFFKEKGYINDFLEKKSLLDAFDALNKSTDPKILQYADDFDTLKKLADDMDAHPELKVLMNNGNPDDVIHAWKMMTENVPPIQLCFF